MDRAMADADGWLKGPARVLVARNTTSVGGAFLDIPVANGTTGFQFVLQGMDWGVGSSAAPVASAPARFESIAAGPNRRSSLAKAISCAYRHG